MKKILFVYDHEYPDLWRDGLWAALKLLQADYKIERLNLQEDKRVPYEPYDFALGWGAFGSPVDQYMRQMTTGKKGLLIAGITPPINLNDPDQYDVLFYETEWFGESLNHRNQVHAFGVNTDIYKPMETPKLFDYLTVGAFAFWKRQTMLTAKRGVRMAIGQIQQNNTRESYEIIRCLLESGCGVMDMVEPERLAQFYNASRAVYIPADINGGGERAVLEARACGAEVEVAPDNPKLIELMLSPVWDHHYYAEKLKAGVESAL